MDIKLSEHAKSMFQQIEEKQRADAQATLQEALHPTVMKCEPLPRLVFDAVYRGGRHA